MSTYGTVSLPEPLPMIFELLLKCIQMKDWPSLLYFDLKRRNLDILKAKNVREQNNLHLRFSKCMIQKRVLFLGKMNMNGKEKAVATERFPLRANTLFIYIFSFKTQLPLFLLRPQWLIIHFYVIFNFYAPVPFLNSVTQQSSHAQVWPEKLYIGSQP